MKRRITREQFLGEDPDPGWLDALGILALVGLLVAIACAGCS